MTTGLTCMLRSGVRVGASGPVVVARLRVRACARGVVRCPCAALFGPRCRRQGFFFFTVPRCVALRSVVLCAMKMWRPDPCGHPLALRANSALSLHSWHARAARMGRGRAAWGDTVRPAGCRVRGAVRSGGAWSPGARTLFSRAAHRRCIDATGRAGARSRHIAGDVRRTTSMS